MGGTIQLGGDSVEVTRSLFQVREGGAVPTSPHQFTVVACDRRDIEGIIEKVHYSHSINGVISDYCFALVFEGKVWGGALFGRPAMVGQGAKYHSDSRKITELRRLVCLDEAPKNSESFFIARCLKELKKLGVAKVLSYVDENYGHTGIIYRASNFTYLGRTSKGRVIYWDGKKYHDKAIRTKHNGVLKPFAAELKEALKSGAAEYKDTLPKHIYLYTLLATQL